MTSKFFSNKHTNKKNNCTKVNKNANSKGKGPIWAFERWVEEMYLLVLGK